MRGDTDNSEPSALSICALGKCGGRELGFASDIELVFVYQGNGKTQGPEVISSSEYFQKLVEEFNHAIRAKRKGIFEIDLRLRPYGSAGSLAVALDAFERYFAPDGAAWPYERQALVKLRPIAGDLTFGEEISKKRDEWIYTSEPFDVAAMRAMRERQVRQLVKAGTTNAKLSPGGLVDCEYLVQGLQISYGRRFPAVRAFNTDQAMTALKEARVLSDEDHRQIRAAYIFQRRLIDALRMVRGDARDLTVPPSESEEFEYLARRLRYGGNLAQLRRDLELHTQVVQDLGRLLDQT
jgi:glutamate-ammonia-ligase adenylyltransferase